ncbi:site-specific integrase [Mangrovibacterium diazotrophicum]|uniref:Site-specific recombinase XerD n=1 Tax=Mangrovibacterium diazotrophicum TaxID=1261403 RepID=A0A419WAN5_9BACT|nr:site-specific integrase [Mangrovibacterium diazotrophicum]RKD92535.1 site-specific recombinase XerD [Mangrovibacterium diazotrophicum]
MGTEKRIRKGTKKNNVVLREKQLASGSISLYLDIYRDGQRSYEFLKLYINPKARSPIDKEQNKANYELANRIRTDRENELNNLAFDYIPPTKQKVLFFDFAQRYLENYTKKDKAMIKGAIEDFKLFLINKQNRIKPEHLKIHQIDRLMVVQFIAFLEEKHKGEGANSYYARFKKILNNAVARNIIPKSPAQKKEPGDTELICKKPIGLQKDILTNEEIQLIAKAPCKRPEIKKAFLFCLCTGLRFVDVKALKFSNIDFSAARLKIEQQKTGKPVIIDLNKTALKLIGETRSSDEIVFSLPGRKWATKTINSLVKNVGINKHITWHCARHSLAVNLLTSDEKPDIKTVSSILGHSSTKTTEVYLHVVDELKKKAVNSLPDYEL